MNHRQHTFSLRLAPALTLIIMLLCSSATVTAQGLNTGYFSDDLKTRHTMNPAIGNEQSYVAIPVIGNVNVKSMGNFGLEDIMFDNPLYGITSDRKKTTFMNPYLTGNVLSGLSETNRLRVQENISLASVGFKSFGGYNTVELNVRTDAAMKLPYELFAFAANQGNKHYDIGDINGEVQSFAELAFGHSRQINEKWRVGGKVKLLFGIAEGTLDLNNVTADLQSDNQWVMTLNGEANVSMRGFKYKTEVRDYKRGGIYERVNGADVDGGGLGGFGVGVDLGAVYKINEDWEVSASLLDLGFISWSNQIVARNDSKPFIFRGFRDIDVHDRHAPEGFDTQTERYSDQIADFASLVDQGDQGGRTTGIGATFTAAGKYTLPAYRRLSFGVLSTTRLGRFAWTEARLNANISPLDWLDGALSFAYSTYSTSMGWMIHIHPKGYNFFFGMDHIMGKFSKEMIPLSSNASVSMGMSITW